MMNRLLLVCFILVGVTPLVWGQGGTPIVAPEFSTSVTDTWKQYATTEVKKYTALKETAPEQERALAAFNLMYKMREVLQATVANPELRKDLPRVEMGYQYAWVAVIRLYQSGKMPEVRHDIISFWDAILSSDQHDLPLVTNQLGSLVPAWNPAFRTEQFMALFDTTLDPALIDTYCEIFVAHGTATERQVIREKLERYKTITELILKRLAGTAATLEKHGTKE